MRIGMPCLVSITLSAIGCQCVFAYVSVFCLIYVLVYIPLSGMVGI